LNVIFAQFSTAVDILSLLIRELPGKINGNELSVARCTFSANVEERRRVLQGSAND